MSNVGAITSPMRSFIIHLTGSTARRPNAEQLLHDLPSAELIEAVNGRDPSQIKHIDTRSGNLHAPSYPFPLTPTEIGVFQSHRRCWQKIVDEGLDMAVTVEDDLKIDPPRFARAMALVDAHATPEMIIRLPVKQRETPADTIATDGDMSLILPRVIALQCCCQVVGHEAAKRLLAASEVIDRPIDTWLQMHWATGQHVHAVMGCGNQEIAGQIGGSTIQQKTRTSGKLMREVRRATYRSRVALRPQKV